MLAVDKRIGITVFFIYENLLIKWILDSFIGIINLFYFIFHISIIVSLPHITLSEEVLLLGLNTAHYVRRQYLTVQLLYFCIIYFIF